MHEQKKKAEDAKRIRDCSRKVTRAKDTSHVQDEVEKLMHQDEQELLSMWEGWHWFDNKGGWLEPGTLRQGKT